MRYGDYMGREADQQHLVEELRRERLLDIEQRLRAYRRAAFAVLALSLIATGPWVGWWPLIPLAVALAAFAVADRFMEKSPHPHRWAAGGWAISPFVIALSIGLTGGPDSPALGWMALPAVTLSARFEIRGVITGLAYMLVLLAASTVGVDPGGAADAPEFGIFAAALVLAVTLLGGAVVQSDREHRREAVLDPLTGLLNRTALAQRVSELEQQSRQAGRREAWIGCLVADIDNFKQVNDTHGHATGDAVLQGVAYTMRNALRAFDLIYRVGGEEFFVLLPGADSEKTVEIAERLRAAVAAAPEGGVDVTVSFGAAACCGDFEFMALYEQADSALFEAKRAGRNRVISSTPVANSLSVHATGDV